MPVNVNRYDEKITRRLFFSMVPVQILLVMCGGISLIIDSAFASNLIGPDAMAVTGLYGPFAKICDSLNVLMFGGAQILCGKYLGENTVKRARAIFSIDILVMSIIGAVGMILCVFFPFIPASLSVSGANPLYPGLMEYFRGVGVGILPFLLGTQLTSFLQLEKKEKIGYIAIGGLFFTNALCDYLFIKVFKMGLFGLGLATSVGNWVSLIIPAVYFLSRNASFKFGLKGLKWSDLADIFKLGTPPAATQFLLVLRGLILNYLIITIAGNAGMSAFSAVGSFGYVYWAIPAGMTSAMVTLASVYTGEKDRSALELLMRIYLKRAVPVVVAGSLVLSALCVPLTNIYYHDPSAPVYTMALIGFCLFPLSSPISTIFVGWRDLWRCMDFMPPVHVGIILDGLAFPVLFSWLLSMAFGMTGIWLSQVISGIGVVMVMYIMAWIRQKSLPKTCADLCCFPKDFGISSDKRLNLSVHSLEEAINISETVIEFCHAQGIEKITSARAGLCVEELTVNIVKHGFSNKANSVVDISVTHAGEDLIIKFKDNCQPFNPKEVDTIFNPEDPAHNIGIRIVRKVCKEMEYQALLGLNVFSIKL